MSTIEDFKNNKYCYVKNALSDDTCKIIANYTLLEEGNNFFPEAVGGQVPGSHGRKCDNLMESLLFSIKPIVEKNTGLYLYPTYSYYRVYRNGSSLIPHLDVESCEISCSILLGKNYPGESWKLYIEDKGFSMNVGDMVVYRGTELNHYRYEFDKENIFFHSQVFLHYVDKNGPYQNLKYDGRIGVGEIDGSLLIQ